jgi:DNA mismatch repair protein MutS
VPEGEVARWGRALTSRPPVHALHAFASGRTLTELPAYRFEAAAGARAVAEAIGVLNLQGFGLESDHPAPRVRPEPGRLRDRQPLRPPGEPEGTAGVPERGNRLLLDPATLRNLEIFASAAAAARDRSSRRWTGRPRPPAPASSSAGSRPPSSTLTRSAGATPWSANSWPSPSRLAELGASLAGVRDIPRILGRLQNRLRNPRELCGVRDTLGRLPGIRAALGGLGPQAAGVRGRIEELPALRAPAGRARRRAAGGRRRGQLRPGGPRRRARPDARPHERQQDVARGPGARGAGAHGHPQPEGQVHEQFRVLHRGHQGQPAPRPRRLHRGRRRSAASAT